jgi:hypothetical protein
MGVLQLRRRNRYHLLLRVRRCWRDRDPVKSCDSLIWERLFMRESQTQNREKTKRSQEWTQFWGSKRCLWSHLAWKGNMCFKGNQLLSNTGITIKFRFLWKASRGAKEH